MMIKLNYKIVTLHRNSFLAALLLCFFIISYPKAALALDKPAISGIKKGSGATLEVSWKSAPGCTGYRVYRSFAYHGTYHLITDTEKTSYADDVSAGNRYYYKIRAYKNIDGKRIYSNYSSVKSGYVTVKDAPASLSATKIDRLSMSGSQLIIVAADKESSSKANVSFYERNDKGKWILDFSTIGYIGANGIGKMKEGDKKTPTGLYHFTTAFGIVSKPEKVQIPYVKVNKTHWLVGDSKSKYYNQFVSTAEREDGYPQTIQAVKDWASSRGEQLYSYAKSYQYALVLDYNPENIPNMGSAIFLHCYSGNQYTSGCIAIPESRMKYLLQNLRIEDDTIEASILIDAMDNIAE